MSPAPASTHHAQAHVGEVLPGQLHAVPVVVREAAPALLLAPLLLALVDPGGGHGGEAHPVPDKQDDVLERRSGVRTLSDVTVSVPPWLCLCWACWPEQPPAPPGHSATRNLDFHQEENLRISVSKQCC